MTPTATHFLANDRFCGCSGSDGPSKSTCQGSESSSFGDGGEEDEGWGRCFSMSEAEGRQGEGAW